MYIKRLFRGGEEAIQDVSALVILAANEQGEIFHIIEGDNEQVRSLFIHGLLNWPMYIPYPKGTAKIIEMVLGRTPLTENYSRMSSNIVSSVMLNEFAGQGHQPIALGEGLEDVSVCERGNDWKGDMVLRGISTSLIFVRQADKKLIGQNGAGSQKLLLVFNGVEVLWGKEMRGRIEDYILGPSKDMWYRMAKGMRNVSEGGIVEIDPNENT